MDRPIEGHGGRSAASGPAHRLGQTSTPPCGNWSAAWPSTTGRSAGDHPNPGTLESRHVPATRPPNVRVTTPASGPLPGVNICSVLRRPWAAMTITVSVPCFGRHVSVPAYAHKPCDAHPAEREPWKLTVADPVRHTGRSRCEMIRVPLGYVKKIPTKLAA